jgi:DNA repair exonuclease SbcCD nuclease subunit
MGMRTRLLERSAHSNKEKEMIKILHTSDIHLDAGKDAYCMEILDALLDRAKKENVAALFLCGDLFHTDSDLFNEDFREIVIEKLNNNTQQFRIYYIPGNHESFNGDYSFMEAFDWKQIDFLPRAKICTLEKDDEKLEIVGIPHSRNYAGLFHKWNPAKKSTKLRIALAHGAIPGFDFLGDEDEAGILSPNIFNRLEVDAVFLGHIHKSLEREIEETRYYYSGSLRPLRTTETGLRKFNLISISNNDIQCITQDFENSGRVRKYSRSLFESDWQDFLPPDLHENDHVVLDLEGIIETQISLEDGCAQIRQKIESCVRKLDLNSDDCTVLSNILSNSFVAKVHKKWLMAKPEGDDEKEKKIWRMSFGLLHKYIKDHI